MAMLPELYPDEEQREAVEKVLIPEFRARLQEVLSQFAEEHKLEPSQPLTPKQIPKLAMI